MRTKRFQNLTYTTISFSRKPNFLRNPLETFDNIDGVVPPRMAYMKRKSFCIVIEPEKRLLAVPGLSEKVDA